MILLTTLMAISWTFKIKLVFISIEEKKNRRHFIFTKYLEIDFGFYFPRQIVIILQFRPETGNIEV